MSNGIDIQNQDLTIQAVVDEIMDRRTKYQFKLEKGLDLVLSLSQPQVTLVEKSQWMMDSDTQQCIICGDKFGLTNRRHHCRRCGRVLCGKCCQKVLGYRYCILCEEILRVVDRGQAMMSFEFDISEYFEKTKLLQIINTQDFLLYGELIRLFQYQMRNDKCREQLLNKWPQLFQKVNGLLKESISTLTKQTTFFITESNAGIPFTKQDALVSIMSCLGLIINFTSSFNDIYAEYLCSNYDVINDLVRLLVDDNIDLIRREHALWTLNNLTQCPTGVAILSSNSQLTKIIYSCFAANVSNITEMTFGVINNLLMFKDSLISDIMPTSTVQDVAEKYELLNIQFAKFNDCPTATKAIMIRTFSLMCSNKKAATQILEKSNYIDTLLDCMANFKDLDKTKVCEGSQEENLLLGSCFNAFCNILKAKCEDQTCIDKLGEQIVSSGFIRIICMYIHQKYTITQMYAVKLLNYLIKLYEEKTLQILQENKKAKQLFVNNMAIAINEQQQNQDVTKSLNSIMKCLGKSHALAKAIKRRQQSSVEDSDDE